MNAPDPKLAADFDFALTHYGGEATAAWLASLAHTYRNGDTLLDAFPRGQRVYDTSDADRVLLAGERAGVLERGKVGFGHSTAAFRGGLELGGARAGRVRDPLPYMHAWTLTPLGVAFFSWRARAA